MAFLMMGEMAGGAGEGAGGEAILRGGAPTLRTSCSFLARKPRGERWVLPEKGDLRDPFFTVRDNI